jgi:hypothetical protein
MEIQFACPACNRSLKASEEKVGKKTRCPKCGQSIFVPPPVGTSKPATLATRSQTPPPASGFPGAELNELAPPPDISRPPERGRRFLSLPWLVAVGFMGFLPWSEVSCRAKDLPIRVTQSGFQALYGGVSSPFLDGVTEGIEETAHHKSPEEWRKKLGLEQPDFLMSCAPFVAVFWGLWIAAVVLTFLPLGRLRLRASVLVCGTMAAMLLITTLTDTPLERRMVRFVGAMVKTDMEAAVVTITAFKWAKTAWFWLVLAGVVLAGVSEGVVSRLWPEPHQVKWPIPAFLAGGGVALGLFGVVVQVGLWNADLTGAEWRLAQITKAQIANQARVKAESDRQAAEARRRAQQEEAERQERQRQEREQLEIRKREAEELRKAQELAAQQARAEAEKARLEYQRQQERLREEERRRLEQERLEAARQEEVRRLEVERRRLAYEREMRTPVPVASVDDLYKDGATLRGRIVEVEAEGTMKVFGANGSLYCYRRGTLLVKIDFDRVDPKDEGAFKGKVRAVVNRNIRGVWYLHKGQVLR